MIRPIARTHQEATRKAERLKQAESTLRNAERQTLYDNLAYGVFFLIVTSGAILIGKFISIIVKSINI